MCCSPWYFSMSLIGPPPVPFFSISGWLLRLCYIYEKNIKIPVTLLWANKSEEELCCRDELARMEEGMDNLKVVCVMSQQEEWKGDHTDVGWFNCAGSFNCVSSMADSTAYTNETGTENDNPIWPQEPILAYRGRFRKVRCHLWKHKIKA